MAGGLVSVGYGGRRPAALIAALQEHDVRVLVDVRLNPVSGIPGYSGGSLARQLQAVGIKYVHEARLGNPIGNREGYRDGLPSAKGGFGRRLASTARPALAWLASLARHQRVAVLCAERDPSQCHRQAVTRAAVLLHPELQLIEL
jgi:uncharacterized protein (DUF488 family)